MKKPSPVIATSSAEPVCSIGPSEKFCVIELTVAPMPWIILGLVSAEPATISAEFGAAALETVGFGVGDIVRDHAERSVWAFFMPLSEV